MGTDTSDMRRIRRRPQVALIVAVVVLSLAVPTSIFFRNKSSNPCDVLGTRSNMVGLNVDWANGYKPKPLGLVDAVESSFQLGGMSRHLSEADLDPVVEGHTSNLAQVRVQGHYYVTLLRQDSGYVAIDRPRLCSSLPASG
jgi:hypothetical protein